MTTEEIMNMGRTAREISRRDLLSRHPELTAEIEAEFNARINALEKFNAEQAERINALTEKLAAAEAERDQWRKQALEENAAADAASARKSARTTTKRRN